MPFAFPACEFHSNHGCCSTCGVGTNISSTILPDTDDSDDSDDEDVFGRSAADVRTDPPRFTPCSPPPFHGPIPHAWSPEAVNGWYVSILADCTGCGKKMQFFRWLFDLAMYQGDPVPNGFRSAEPQRYKHRLCRRCAVSVVMREQSHKPASYGCGLILFEIKPTKLPRPRGLGHGA